MNELLLLVVGFFVGMFGTLIGVGGGFIIVPLLTMVYHFTPQHAVGTSMVIVSLNAISGSIAYIRQKRIDYRTGLLFAAATLPGSFLGAFLLQSVSSDVFDVTFGLLLMSISLYLAIRKQDAFQTFGAGSYQPPHYSKPAGLLISFCVGFVASMAGIGGGVVHVPAMIYLFHFPPFIAIPTSHFILAISATFAAGSHGIIGEVAWDIVPFLGVGAVVGAQVGGLLSHKIQSTWIIRALLVVMFIVAVRLIGRHL